ncbi:MAG: hypothetical protein QOG92_785, partial [Verrucomicrobiota bacterium]|nr:hypothetical protein [Verrucomicrobiota bacterium]
RDPAGMAKEVSLEGGDELIGPVRA